jgi:hypothetical protein
VRILALVVSVGCVGHRRPVTPVAPDQPVPEPVPSEPEPAVGCGLGTAHEVWADWAFSKVEAIHGRAALVVPPGTKTLRLSPELDYQVGRPGSGFELVGQRSTIGLGAARAIDDCGDWARVGVRMRMDGPVVELSSFGTFERDTAATFVRGVVVGPPGVTVTRTMDLYGSVQFPGDLPDGSYADAVQVDGDWVEVELLPDPNRLSEIFGSTFAAINAEIEHDLAPANGLGTLDWDQITPFPPGDATVAPDRAVEDPAMLSVAQVDAVFEAHAADLRACADAMWKVHPDMAGSLPMTFSVDRDGAVQHLHILEGYVMQAATKATWASVLRQQTALEGCVASALWSWTFPRPAYGEAVVRYQIDLSTR